MPVIEVMNLFRKAVLWTKSGVNDYGVATVEIDPIEINSRWETAPTESGASDNEVQSSQSSVIVDRDIEVGSVIWLGTLADLPAPESQLMQVMSFTKVPDIKCRKFHRSVMVKRFTDSLPQQQGQS